MKTTIENNPHAAGKAAHTPTPWVCWLPERRLAHSPCISGPKGWSIATLHDCGTENREIDRENAKFIVKACNNHAALVNALKALVCYHANLCDRAKKTIPIDRANGIALKKARAALEAAQ